MRLKGCENLCITTLLVFRALRSFTLPPLTLDLPEIPVYPSRRAQGMPGGWLGGGVTGQHVAPAPFRSLQGPFSSHPPEEATAACEGVVWLVAAGYGGFLGEGPCCLRPELSLKIKSFHCEGNVA